jgi:hypothetical protein
MKKLYGAIFALALLISFGGAHEAKAAEPSGHSFCPAGFSDLEDLAQRMDRALVADPTGEKQVKIEKCHASMLHFLVAFQTIDPGAGLTDVKQLPDYIRSLVVMPTEAGLEYTSSCLKDRPNGVRDVDLGCDTKEIRPGEKVYGNPKTGIKVLKQFCANPGAVENPPVVVQARCIPYRFPSMPGTPIRVAYIGANPLPGRCYKLQLAGEQAPRFDMPEECPNIFQVKRGDRMVTVVCAWAEVERMVSRLLGFAAKVQNVSLGVIGRGKGTNTLWLPPEAANGAVVVCYQLPNGQYVTLGMRRKDLVDADGGATIPTGMVYGPNPAVYRGN